MTNLVGTLELSKGWVRLIPPDGLGSYLRRLFWLHTHRVYKLHAPSNGDHISVAEPGRASEALLGMVGQDFPFSLNLNPQTNGNAVWLDCEIPDLEPHRAIRSDFHLVIGYLSQSKTRWPGVNLGRWAERTNFRESFHGYEGRDGGVAVW